MHLVIDANILVAAILRASTTRKILFDPRLQISIPQFIREEIEKHKEELRKKARLSSVEWEEVVDLLFAVMEEAPLDDYHESREKALESLEDPKDWPYLALALVIQCDGIWSNDKHLLRQTLVKTYTTGEIVDLLNY